MTVEDQLEARLQRAFEALDSVIPDEPRPPLRQASGAGRPARWGGPAPTRQWLVPALAAACVALLVGGTVLTVRAVHSGSPAAPSRSLAPAAPAPSGPTSSQTSPPFGHPSQSSGSASRATSSATGSGNHTGATAKPPTVTPAQAAAIMSRTIEREAPTESFAPDSPVQLTTVSDGQGGTLSAAIGLRNPSADAKGSLVFFWHNADFLGWDSQYEATLTWTVTAAGTGAFAVSYQQYASSDPTCCPSLPKLTVDYRWNGSAMVPSQPLPNTVYGPYGPTTHKVAVVLQPS